MDDIIDGIKEYHDGYLAIRLYPNPKNNPIKYKDEGKFKDYFKKEVDKEMQRQVERFGHDGVFIKYDIQEENNQYFQYSLIVKINRIKSEFFKYGEICYCDEKIIRFNINK